MFSKKVWLLIIVSSLGYFVDVYDLLVFSIVRKASLISLGVSTADQITVGLSLQNWQAAGLLIGGILWGVLGDKRGRLSVLSGSITIYSIANILNAYATTIPMYALLRFVAGLGLAGELGAGITLVSEMVPKEKRGVATMIVATVGLLGAAAASYVGLNFDWRVSYMIGGIGGFLLLLLRFGTFESGLFEKTKNLESSLRGSLKMILTDSKKLTKYILCILSGSSVYFIVGILVTYSPEFGTLEGLKTIPVAGIAVLVLYIALAVGDVLCSSLSQKWKSRRKALIIFNIVAFVTCLSFLFWKTETLFMFYFKVVLMGLGAGFWAVLNTNAAEQFGTNLRATVATTVPNFVRGMLIPMAWLFTYLKVYMGTKNSAFVVCLIVSLLSIGSSYLLEESFEKDMDFVDIE